MESVAATDKIETLQVQVALLGEALGRILVRLGVINDVSLTGPQLLAAAEDFISAPEPTLDAQIDATTITALSSGISQATSQRDTAMAERDAVMLVLEGQRSALCSPLKRIYKAIHQHEWLKLGRGSYEYNDARWRDEFSQCLAKIEEALVPLNQLSRDWANCPTDAAALREARQLIKLETANRELDEKLQKSQQDYETARRLLIESSRAVDCYVNDATDLKQLSYVPTWINNVVKRIGKADHFARRQYDPALVCTCAPEQWGHGHVGDCPLAPKHCICRPPEYDGQSRRKLTLTKHGPNCPLAGDTPASSGSSETYRPKCHCPEVSRLGEHSPGCVYADYPYFGLRRER